MSNRFCVVLLSLLLSGAAQAAPGDQPPDQVRNLTARVGSIIGSAAACSSIPRPRVQSIADKFASVIREASSTEAERVGLSQLLDRNIADGHGAVMGGQLDCRAVERQMGELERSIAVPNEAALAWLSSAAAAVSIGSIAPATSIGAVHGVTDRELRFGMSAAFTGPVRERGRQMKLGIETAFNQVNDAGGVNGRMLRLVTAEDGNEPKRTLEAIKQLYERDQVFGVIGSIGTATAAAAVPYALERRMLFFGAFTGGTVVRHDPPDRYVFNYRPSYAEETDAAVRYLVKIRRLSPKHIVVFAQQDDLGDAGYAGVTKAFRALGVVDSSVLRVNYARNSVDVEDAVNQLKALKTPVKAIVMAASYRAAAKFIEKTHDLFPGVLYTNISGVGGTALAEELMLLGPRYTSGVIVTQVVPAVSGYSSLVLDYKNSLAKYFPGEASDYVSLEGFVSASVMIQALKRAGPQLDTEKLVDALEATRNLDLGLGTMLNFGPAEHQASHKIWGTALDETGRFQAIELE